MGLLRNRGDDGPQGRTYQMRERMLAIGDDYWIEDDVAPVLAVTVAVDALSRG